MPITRQFLLGGPVNLGFVRLGIIAFALGMWQPLTIAAPAQGQAQVKASIAKAKPVKRKVIVRSGAKSKLRAGIARANSMPLKPSYGQLAGLHGARDALELNILLVTHFEEQGFDAGQPFRHWLYDGHDQWGQRETARLGGCL